MIRLLSTTKDIPELEEHDSERPPRYGVLSHRWLARGEISFHDFQEGNFDRNGPGYRKILGACRLARKLDLRYMWIDTCCIEKTPLECDVAIKSMFKWYEKAALCIAYLGDVRSVRESSLHKSEWFTRGWTLQELIAPREVRFYNMDWEFIGSRTRLSHIISAITRIGQPYLDGSRSYTQASIAQRLSWAAGRITTLPPDRAYCLMGLLGVKILADYSETFDQAWFRLQLQILRQSEDESIFAWSLNGDETVYNDDWSFDSDYHDKDTAFGLLARDPSDFLGSFNIRSGGKSSLSYWFEKNSLRIEQRVGSRKHELKGSFKESLDLACYDESQPPEHGNMVSITLQRINGLWYRVDCFRQLSTGHWTRRAQTFTRYCQEFVCQAYPGVHKTSTRVRELVARERSFYEQGAHMNRKITVVGAIMTGAAVVGLVRKQLERYEQRKGEKRLHRQRMCRSMEKIERLQEWAERQGNYVPHRLSDSRSQLEFSSDGGHPAPTGTDQSYLD